MFRACTCVPDKGDISIYAINVRAVDHPVLKLFPLYCGSDLNEKSPRAPAECACMKLYFIAKLAREKLRQTHSEDRGGGIEARSPSSRVRAILRDLFTYENPRIVFAFLPQPRALLIVSVTLEVQSIYWGKECLKNGRNVSCTAVVQFFYLENKLSLEKAHVCFLVWKIVCVGAISILLPIVINFLVI